MQPLQPRLLKSCACNKSNESVEDITVGEGGGGCGSKVRTVVVSVQEKVGNLFSSSYIYILSILLQ